ncbi:hypothetical protein KFE80_00380 [bacterium SCSIO 12696]|nr:hypothetical protein KFE80_00380 [bacterium SCSIO 12696]
MDLKQNQKACCNHYKADFIPPNPDQMVAISEGVLSGTLEIEGVRYPSPEHMSGWWLTTDLYNGDVESLETVHFSHVADARPEIAQYLALPFGYRFVLGGESEHVWFDNEVAESV